jgi:ribosomal protein S18 acetylase RimI-like enzyme
MIEEFELWHKQQPWYGEKHIVADLSRGYLDPDDLYIELILVRPEMKRQGIGRAILTKLCEIADAHNVVLALEASEDSKDADWLQDWYARYGFEYSADGRGDYGPYMIRQPRNSDDRTV